jgi:hypothetical protein
MCGKFSFVGQPRYDFPLRPRIMRGREITVNFKGAHVTATVNPTWVRWSVACPLSYSWREELMQESGGSVGMRPSLSGAA